MKNISVVLCLCEKTDKIEVLKEKDSEYRGTFTVENTGVGRKFSIETNAPLETKLNDSQLKLYQEYLPNPRVINESIDRLEPTLEGDRIAHYPTVKSGLIWFDALYTLAIEEVRQCSVDNIKDGSYNNGQPLSEPASGGYFETGLFWNYVWTRDISYSIDLSLANINPLRALNSLNFKLSELRSQSSKRKQIIQDTGTGGSYPISSDRVVWSLGSRALLRQLPEDKRDKFKNDCYNAIKNTIEHDRLVIYDAGDGLYRGEQSFLDWREQSYPIWTAKEPVKIGMSKALSTNCCHFHALKLAASLAGELGKTEERQKYDGWAQDLRQAIRTNLYLPEEHLYSTFITTTFAPGSAHQYDLLGNALAILLDIADEEQAIDIVSHYPHLPKGPSVIWPQQRDTLIYHNQGMWPFATAYWLRAAKKVKNDRAVTLGISSLVRGAALSLSNMENFDAASGRVELETEPKEPQVNSPRQLWSVAGYLSAIHDIIFGLTWTDSGMSIEPYITREFRNNLLPKSDRLVLNGLPYRGRQLDITINLPPVTEEMESAYEVAEIRLNGKVITSDIAESMLSDRNKIEVDLSEGNKEKKQHSPLKVVANLEDYRQRFAPFPPTVDSIKAIGDRLEIRFHLNNENPDEVTLNVYRDGQLVAKGLSGHSTTWRDPDSAVRNSPSYCYNLETAYIKSGTISQRSAPFCYWGVNDNRIYDVNADQFSAIGGNWSDNYGRGHFENWGEPEDSITAKIQAKFNGRHAIQAVAGNGSGPINTGITCAVKRLEMKDLENETIVAFGYLIMPQLGTWDRWLESSVIFTKVDLTVGRDYQIKIFADDKAINMSSFAHNAQYTGGNGGSNGPYNYVNIAGVKLMSLETQNQGRDTV